MLDDKHKRESSSLIKQLISEGRIVRPEEGRERFTYEMGGIAELNKARTSVKRANEFLTEVRKIIGK